MSCTILFLVAIGLQRWWSCPFKKHGVKCRSALHDLPYWHVHGIFLFMACLHS